MRSPLNSPLMLGSVSPLQVLRGITDMSFNWLRASSLSAGARALSLLATIWGLVTVASNPERGLAIAGVGLIVFFVIGRR